MEIARHTDHPAGWTEPSAEAYPEFSAEIRDRAVVGAAKRKALASAVGLVLGAVALAVGTLIAAFLVSFSTYGTNVSRDEEAIAVLVLGGAAVLAALWRAGLVLRRGFRRR